MFEESYIIAHRGIHNNKTIYENTKEAFALAIKQKYIIELDVRLTKDNQVIVFHDSNTKRLTGQNKIVAKNTYQELNAQNIFHIPLLSEVLKQVNGKVPLLIEIKAHETTGKLEKELMKLLENYQGKYAIQSFSPRVLYWFKRNYPNILRGQLSSKYTKSKLSNTKKFILSNMLLNNITKPHFISYKYNELSPKEISKYKKKGIRVIGWTITNERELNHYKKYYDNLICEKTNIE